MAWTGIIGNGLAWFLLWLFARAIFHKVAASRYYRQLISQYLEGRGGVALLWLIVGLETATVLSLLLSQWRSVGLAMAAVLLLIYGGLMASRILGGRAAMPCGCAGPDSELAISWTLVVRNGFCAGLALLAMHSTGPVAPGWVGASASGLVALLLVMLYLTSDLAIRNAQWMEGDG